MIDADTLRNRNQDQISCLHWLGQSDVIKASILARIRKCFGITNHAATPEAEAKAVLRMGSTLMPHHNVTRAEVFGQRGDNI